MYIRKRRLTLLTIKNMVFFLLGMILAILGIVNLLSLFIYYHGDMEVLRYAASTPSSIRDFIVGMLLVVIAYVSQNLISDARFYFGFLECDLDGIVRYEDFSAVTGRKPELIEKEFRFLMPFYMRGFVFAEEEKQLVIKANDRKILCNCNNCGAQIERSMYYIGQCAYCGGSSLSARVLTEKRFYSIQSENAVIGHEAGYYRKENLNRKRILTLIIGTVMASIVLIMICYSISQINDYLHYDAFISDYYHGVLFEGKPEQLYRDIKPEGVLDGAVWGIGFALCFGVIAAVALRIFYLSDVACRCADFLSRRKKQTPFITAGEINKKLGMKKAFPKLDRAIRRGYLKNCTFEKTNKSVKFAVAKTVQKDKCPFCAGAIVGAVDESYQCRYCGRKIMDVVVMR